MREFFKGWRRKVGCALLVMACAVMAHWFRSQLIEDEIYNDFSQCTLATGGGSLLWSRRELRLEGLSEPVWICGGGIEMEEGWQWQSEPYKRDDLETSGRGEFLTRYWIPGGEFAVVTRSRRILDITQIDTVSFWEMSLLWLVIPLMLLSAYLILWKPRKKVERDA